MNLRTITMWCVYAPMGGFIMAARKTKKEGEQLMRESFRSNGFVLVKMKGHYVRRPSTRKA